MLENENDIKLVSCLLYICTALFAIIGGLVVTIWRQHEKENDKQFDNNREDHIRINERIDEFKKRGR